MVGREREGPRVVKTSCVCSGYQVFIVVALFYFESRGKPNDYDDGVEYFKNKFLSMNQKKQKQIFTHVTCATDPENVGVVFNACKETILRSNLQGSGFME